MGRVASSVDDRFVDANMSASGRERSLPEPTSFVSIMTGWIEKRDKNVTNSAIICVQGRAKTR
jgi:hypothetical protein